MIKFKSTIKNFSLLEILVITSFIYVFLMLTWTATTRSAVEERANQIKDNHVNVVNFLNDEVNKCTNSGSNTSWGEPCNSTWTSNIIVNYILNNLNFKNPYSINKPLIQAVIDPRIEAEGKAGQSTNKGVIFVSSDNFNAEAGSEWVVGTCIKSPCVAAGNNELVSVYR